MSEMCGVYKIGNGGMTSLARAILDEYTGDRLFDTVVTDIRQVGRGVEVLTKSGQMLRANSVISTIPL